MRTRLLAAVAAVALGLSACSDVEEAARKGQELIDLTVEKVKNFDWSKLDEFAGTRLADNASVQELVRAMPSGEDIASIDVSTTEGKLVITYNDDVAEIDPALLEETMSEVSGHAKDFIGGLSDVEFKVGDKTYSF